MAGIRSFFRGVIGNVSIRIISFNQMNLFEGDIFRSLRPFFENNNSLAEVDVEECEFGAGCARQLSLVLSCCNKSLKGVGLLDIEMGGGQLVDIFEALGTHHLLETLYLPNLN